MGTLFSPEPAGYDMEGTDPGDDDPVEDDDPGGPGEDPVEGGESARPDDPGPPDEDPGDSGLPDDIHVSAMNHWDRVIDDMEATAEEYEQQGWATLQLHPGDVTPLSGEYADRIGLDVLVPGEEFEALRSLLSGGVEFDDSRVFKTQRSNVVFALVAMEDSSSAQAVLVPVFYSAGDRAARRMLERARAEGAFRSYVRRLGGDYVELTHLDPDTLAPPGEG